MGPYPIRTPVESKPSKHAPAGKREANVSESTVNVRNIHQKPHAVSYLRPG